MFDFVMRCVAKFPFLVKTCPMTLDAVLSYHPLRITLDMFRTAEATVKAIKDNELRK